MVLRLSPVSLDGRACRRLLQVCHELVLNALKHAFRDRGGRLEVELAVDGDLLRLVVSDDGPGFGAVGAAGSGLGSGIVSALVDRAGGSLSSRRCASGTSVRVELPYDPAATARRV